MTEESNPSSNSNADEITLSKKEYDELLGQISEAQALKNRLLSSAADFENAKKRLTRERDDFVKFSQENLIRSLLPVLDNFERALAHAGEDAKNMKGVITGIQMVYKQLMEILKAQGLKRIQSVGEKFDPHKHEAIAHVQ